MATRRDLDHLADRVDSKVDALDMTIDHLAGQLNEAIRDAKLAQRFERGDVQVTGTMDAGDIDDLRDAARARVAAEDAVAAAVGQASTR